MAAPQNAPKIGGTWLYKQGELVLGPLSGEQVVLKLFDGEIDGATLISRMGDNNFVKLSGVGAFKVELAKAEAKHRVAAQAAAERAAAAKTRNAKLAAVGAAGVVAAVVVGYFGYQAAVHGGGADGDFDGITIEPPTIALARARPWSGEELVEYPGARAPAGGNAATRRPAPAAPTAKAPAAAAKAPAPASPSRPAASGRMVADADGLATAEFDQEAINAVVAKHKSGLLPCLKEDAKDRGLSGKVPIEFVIGNDGRVAKLWVDHPNGKGPLHDCLLRELQKWPFKAYPGERATVGLSFNIAARPG